MSSLTLLMLAIMQVKGQGHLLAVKSCEKYFTLTEIMTNHIQDGRMKFFRSKYPELDFSSF
jgi:hypothetical protein